MDHETERYLAEVKAVVLGQLKGWDVSVYLFGSRASGDSRHTSDIDLAIEARDALPPIVLAALRERLEESTVPYRVDIVDLARISQTP